MSFNFVFAFCLQNGKKFFFQIASETNAGFSGTAQSFKFDGIFYHRNAAYYHAVAAREAMERGGEVDEWGIVFEGHYLRFCEVGCFGEHPLSVQVLIYDFVVHAIDWF